MRSRLLVKGMQVRLGMFVLVIAVLALAGCANPTGAQQAVNTAVPTSAASGSAETATTAPAATEVMPEATEAMATAEPGTGASGPATVMVSDNAQFGQILTDDKGMTLYLFTNDTPNTSNCYDACAEKWPPLLTSGDAMAGTGADESLLGTTQRTDGTTQVTYNGWPLYYWYNDTKAGDATGQNVGGVWFVLSPKGEAVQTAPAGG